MAAINRIAYPRFMRHPGVVELRELHAPTEAELDWAEATTAKRPASLLALLVLFKALQRLGLKGTESLDTGSCSKFVFMDQPTQHIPPLDTQAIEGLAGRI